MLRQHTKYPALLVLLALAACGNEAADQGAASIDDAASQRDDKVARSPGKPSAPIAIEYEVIGRPIVGLPVSINLLVRGTRDNLGAVKVNYSINDRSALRFQEGQVQSYDILDLRDARREQLSVIPQREGRLYVNVSAEIETPGGSMIKSLAIPIQVGDAPEATRNDGEVKRGPDGELVQSMPAREN
ncbi:MAG: hypothetical protein R3192_17845 [Woeseiaceae bacterium]|nr:hypothetical protein [Woeseiaceae bacterium]